MSVSEGKTEIGAGAADGDGGNEDIDENREKQIVEALNFYNKFQWARTCLWRIERFRPPEMVADIEACKDEKLLEELEEFWQDQVDTPLPKREIHFIYAVMSMWTLSTDIMKMRDPRMRLHMLYELMQHNKRMMVQALIRAPDTIGIEPLGPVQVAYDAELSGMWVEETEKVARERGG